MTYDLTFLEIVIIIATFTFSGWLMGSEHGK